MRVSSELGPVDPHGWRSCELTASVIDGSLQLQPL